MCVFCTQIKVCNRNYWHHCNLAVSCNLAISCNLAVSCNLTVLLIKEPRASATHPTVTTYARVYICKCSNSHLFVEWSLQPEISRTHHEFLGCLGTRLGCWFLRSIGQLSDCQAHWITSTRTQYNQHLQQVIVVTKHKSRLLVTSR